MYLLSLGQTARACNEGEKLLHGAHPVWWVDLYEPFPFPVDGLPAKFVR